MNLYSRLYVNMHMFICLKWDYNMNQAKRKCFLKLRRTLNIDNQTFEDFLEGIYLPEVFFLNLLKILP
jgi:hypothetical protein